MQFENLYEVRVKVKTLADASKVIQILDEAGYREVEMGPPRPPLPIEPVARAAAVMRGRFNIAILKALQELGATDKEHALSVEEIIAQMEKTPKFVGLLECMPQGILSRTVNMIASVVLADKHGLVSYDEKGIPRKFWLTEKGAQKANALKHRCGGHNDA